MRYVVFNRDNGFALGVYHADDKVGACESCARDAGYLSVFDMETRLGQASVLVAVPADRAEDDTAV